MQAQSGAPNVSCALLLVQAPQHFTQVGCNFCIGAFFPGLQQQCASLFGLAGVITGIVAAARNSGRLWGVIAIIAGLIAPFVVTGVVFA